MLKQYYLGCLSHASYMLWDPESLHAIVVDPQRDVQQYLDDAAALGLTIEKVVLTHFHADFIAGHLELQAETGADIVMGARAETEYPIVHARHGDRWEYPTMHIEVLESPGHTPEMINLLVSDPRDPTTPKAVLTGDTLFNGDVGRPDLLASRGVGQEELAGMLFESVQMLKALPDDTVVYPAHGAGSMCGKALSGDAVTTIGEQKAVNYAMQATAREDFVRLVSADQGQPPAYFAYDADLNRQHRPLLAQQLETLSPLDLDTLLHRANAGAQVVDTRDPDDHAASFLPGSINIGLDGRYAEWCGTVLDSERPIIIIAEPGKHEESALRLGRIGYDRIEGYLAGGFPTLAARGDLLETRPRLSPDALPEHPGVILDVRSAAERSQASIPGSIHIPLNELPCRSDELPKDTRIVVHCAGGYRSSIAASLLRKHGHLVTDLVGGIAAYAEQGGPVHSMQDGIEQVPVQGMDAVLAAGVPLVDCREQDEWDDDHIDGALLRPLSRIDAWQDEFAGQKVLLQCRSGRRSQTAALHLLARGHEAANLTGGILAYRQEHP